MKLWKETEVTLVRQAARRANSIRAAIADSVDKDKLIAAFRKAFKEDSKATPQEIRNWVQEHAKTKNKDMLIAALENIYAVGYTLGEDAALAAYSIRNLRKAAPSDKDQQNAVNTDWSSWTPGNHPAELLVRPKGGLKNLLRNSGIMANDLTDTTLNRIGSLLADTLLQGLTDRELSRNIDQLLNDPQRSLIIANTEMNRAMSQASMDSYEEFGVDKVEWVTADPCEICSENEDAGAIPTGDQFPSGDTEPPAHPNCRCAIAPVIEGNDKLAKSAQDEEAIGRALERLAILPTPPQSDEPELFVASPWRAAPLAKWDNLSDPELADVYLDELQATDLLFNRHKLARHIIDGTSTIPLVLDKSGTMMILDGHHNLMAQWLLGKEQAQVLLVRSI